MLCLASCRFGNNIKFWKVDSIWSVRELNYVSIFIQCTLASQLAEMKTSHIILPQLYNITIFHPKLWKCHQSSNDYYVFVSVWPAFIHIHIQCMLALFLHAHMHACMLFCHNFSFHLTACMGQMKSNSINIWNALNRKHWHRLTCTANTFGIQHKKPRKQ